MWLWLVLLFWLFYTVLHVADVMLGYYDLLLVVFEFGVGFGAGVLFDG